MYAPHKVFLEYVKLVHEGKRMPEMRRNVKEQVANAMKFLEIRRKEVLKVKEQGRKKSCLI